MNFEEPIKLYAAADDDNDMSNELDDEDSLGHHFDDEDDEEELTMTSDDDEELADDDEDSLEQHGTTHREDVTIYTPPPSPVAGYEPATKLSEAPVESVPVAAAAEEGSREEGCSCKEGAGEKGGCRRK